MDLSAKHADVTDSRAFFWGFKMWREVVVALTAPFVFLFVPRSWDRMPETGWLRYYQCWLYGINGDQYWCENYTEDQRRGWLRRTLWCWRNANVWDYENGVRPADITEIEYEGEIKVGNHPLVEGELAIHAWDNKGRRYWEYYTVRKSWIPGRCSRSRIGWKLKDILDEKLKDGVLNNDPNQRAMVPSVYSTNPLMGYTS